MTFPAVKIIAILNVFWCGFMTFPAVGQTDTTMANHRSEYRDPGDALRRSIIPGWGQIYNREVYKVPIVYVGLLAFAGSALLVNRRYQLYRHAYLFTARVNPDGSPVFPEYKSDYSRLLRDLELRPEENLMPDEIEARRNRLEPQIRSQRDALRRNRDLLFFGTIAWYGLTMIDAYVSAHLSEFDVTESLSVRMTGGVDRMGLALTW